MKYECKKHKELGFYVNGNLKRFSEGVYCTDNKKEIAVLDALIDTEKVEEVEETEELGEEKGGGK